MTLGLELQGRRVDHGGKQEVFRLEQETVLTGNGLTLETSEPTPSKAMPLILETTF